jgi:hypothetical protein
MALSALSRRAPGLRGDAPGRARAPAPSGAAAARGMATRATPAAAADVALEEHVLRQMEENSRRWGPGPGRGVFGFGPVPAGPARGPARPPADPSAPRRAELRAEMAAVRRKAQEEASSAPW